jgi:hypothetical protein
MRLRRRRRIGCKGPRGGESVFVLAVFLLFLSRFGGADNPRSAPPPGGFTGSFAPREETPIPPLLRELWDSGFFRTGPIIREEILNNEYQKFDESAPQAVLRKSDVACYSRTSGRRDAIFLRKDVFAHFTVGLDGVAEQGQVGKKVRAVLVHELCHDFWVNVLDERERKLFALEAEEFVAGYRQARTKEEKRLYRAFGGLNALIDAYPEPKLFGTELFAWFAERAYASKASIPDPFWKYYLNILAEARPRVPNPTT